MQKIENLIFSPLGAAIAVIAFLVLGSLSCVYVTPVVYNHHAANIAQKIVIDGQEYVVNVNGGIVKHERTAK